MATQELVDYIRTRKTSGLSDDEIKKELISAGWAENDLKEFFSQSVITAPLETKPILEQADKDGHAQASKPKGFKLISLLFYFISILYLTDAVLKTAPIVILDYYFQQGGLANAWLKIFPTFGILPIILSLFSYIFFYLGLKIRQGSKMIYKLGLFSTLLIPGISMLITEQLLAPIMELANMRNGAIDFEFATTNTPKAVPRLFLVVLSLITLVLLSRAKKSVSGKAKLTKRGVIGLIIGFLLIVLPISTLVALGYIRAVDTDFGYTEAQEQVDYHVYRLQPIPDGFENATHFATNEDLADIDGAVRVVYDLDFVEAYTNGSRAVAIDQVGVKSDFNLEEYVQSINKDRIIETINLPNAKDNKAYLLEKEGDKLHFILITFITTDDVLIQLVTPRVEKQKMIEMASSLK